MNLVPIEQLVATGIAGEIISGGQKGNAAAIVKRANTALAVSAAFAQLSQGNAAPGVTALGSALSNSDLDPAVAIAVQGLFGIFAQQAALFLNINASLPGLGTVATTIMQNVASGITTAANAELAKYTNAATPQPPKPA